MAPPGDGEVDSALGPPVPCESTWTLLGHHCHKIFVNPASYRDGEELCRQNGGNLGSIHSTNTNGFVKDLVSQENVEGSVWVGMTYKGFDLGWAWEDGTAVSFTNWDQGQPDSWQEYSGDCVRMVQNGEWPVGMENTVIQN